MSVDRDAYELSREEIRQDQRRQEREEEERQREESYADDDRKLACHDQLVAALEDLLSGWRYIRETHGDLYGVGWDRAEEKAAAALAAAKVPQ